VKNGLLPGLVIALAFSLSPLFGAAQEFVYVNTDNLIIRDRPQRQYRVVAIAHAPCRLKVEPYEPAYWDSLAVKKQFYRVSLQFDDAKGIHNHFGGWVEKKYVVTDTAKINWPVAQKGLALSASIVKVPSYMGEDERSPDPMNYADFRYPAYKGGVNQPPPPRRVYHKGPKGGCYYMGKHGRKVYVDKRFCGGK